MGGPAHPFDRVVQRAVGERIGDEFLGPELEQLVQRDRADLLGDHQNLDALLDRDLNEIGDGRQLVLVILIDGQCHEFQGIGIGLPQEHRSVAEGQVAPAFAALGLHVFDEKIEILYIPADRAGHDRRWVWLQSR